MDKKLNDDSKKLTELLQKAAELKSADEQAAFLSTVSKIIAPSNTTLH